MGVRLVHPDLPGQQITVAESAAPIHQLAGWEPAEGQEVTWAPLPPESLPFGGQQPVRLRHPDLPGQEITVAESAVPFHRSKGWQPTDDQQQHGEGPPPAPASDTDQAVAAAGQEPQQEATPARHRGRQNSEEER